MSDAAGESRTHHSTSTRKPRKSRGRGLRTNTGCRICRKRHMKCDEVKPICGPCIKSQRPCVYDEDARSAPTRRQDGTSTSHPPDETRSARPASAANTQAWFYNRSTSAVSRAEEGSVAETASAGWFGLLSADTSDVSLDMQSGCSTGDTTGADASRGRPDVMQVSTIAPSTAADHDQERVLWQSEELLKLRGLEYDMYHHFVTVVSTWIDVFDQMRHFATLVPRLALHNEGLMKAILAVGARNLAFRAAADSCEITLFKHAAVQYYSETLHFLQSTMRYTSYKNSQELLATTLIISAYEMLDGAGKGWERHLKGVFWIQRTREINGESGGLEQAVWWAWIHQDLWAAFREKRRCFSFFKPTKPYAQMSAWDLASRIVYILAQCVNFSSDEEKMIAERDPANRIARANELHRMLEEWNENKGVCFDPLPLEERSDKPFSPLWIHPSVFAIAVQMYHVAYILLMAHQPVGNGYPDSSERDRRLLSSVDVVAGIAMKSPEDATRPLSTQCLVTAGLFCADEIRREGLLKIVEESTAHTAWFTSFDLLGELKKAWYGIASD